MSDNEKKFGDRSPSITQKIRSLMNTIQEEAAQSNKKKNSFSVSVHPDHKKRNKK